MSSNDKVVLTVKRFDGYDRYNGSTIVITKDQKKIAGLAYGRRIYH